ncbi:DUF1214 domain-containing protein [Minwuia sp.]|uniref:DUF1214 domain-containing protein n=1 Tax=Minwuia sp. TaxID=2493630 RepID=UPI003A91693B
MNIARFRPEFEARRFYLVLSGILVGGILGVGSALFAVKTVSDTESPRIGAWQALADPQAAEPNFWLRTAWALSGQFTLRGDTPVHYTAIADDAGDRLKANCTYHLNGPAIGADWWSLAVYGKDHAPVTTAAGRWSVTADDARPDSPARVQIQIGGSDPGGLWIPTGDGEGTISMTLRVYAPDALLGDGDLFSIDRDACG